MGTWGPGVFQNDHARDLCSIEAAQLGEKLEKVLAIPKAAFDDIEGPLIYVHLLARLAEEYEVSEIERATGEAWKKKYLDIFNSTIGDAKEEYLAKRREVIAREFDALIAKLPEPEEAPKPPPKKRTKKAPR